MKMSNTEPCTYKEPVLLRQCLLEEGHEGEHQTEEKAPLIEFYPIRLCKPWGHD